MGERISVRFYPEETRKSYRSKRFAICFLIILIVLVLVYIAAFLEMSRENSTCESPSLPILEERTQNTHKEVHPSIPLQAKTERHVLIHIVEEEQTLYSIARSYKVSVENIRKTNNLRDNTIKTGMRLMIPIFRHQKEQSDCNTTTIN